MPQKKDSGTPGAKRKKFREDPNQPKITTFFRQPSDQAQAQTEEEPTQNLVQPQQQAHAASGNAPIETVTLQNAPQATGPTLLATPAASVLATASVTGPEPRRMASWPISWHSQNSKSAPSKASSSKEDRITGIKMALQKTDKAILKKFIETKDTKDLPKTLRTMLQKYMEAYPNDLKELNRALHLSNELHKTVMAIFIGTHSGDHSTPGPQRESHTPAFGEAHPAAVARRLGFDSLPTRKTSVDSGVDSRPSSSLNSFMHPAANIDDEDEEVIDQELPNILENADDAHTAPTSKNVATSLNPTTIPGDVHITHTHEVILISDSEEEEEKKEEEERAKREEELTPEEIEIIAIMEEQNPHWDTEGSTLAPTQIASNTQHQENLGLNETITNPQEELAGAAPLTQECIGCVLHSAY